MDLSTAALRIMIDGHRSIAEGLEKLLEEQKMAGGAIEPTTGLIRREPGVTFDPENDAPRVLPKSKGTPEEQQWCMVLFFGRLRAINVRQGRGATPDEQRAIGYAAGYKGRSGYNGWPWTYIDQEDGRWISDDADLQAADVELGRISGMSFLRWAALQLDISLPTDLL